MGKGVGTVSVIVSYLVNQELYYALNTEHDAFLITTEYRCGNKTLVQLQVGAELNAFLTNHLKDILIDSSALPGEHFLLKKARTFGRAKPITRLIFNKILKRFDKGKMAVEQEILEKHTSLGKNGYVDDVSIVITVKEGKATAMIDFRDEEQYKSVIVPPWLMKLA